MRLPTKAKDGSFGSALGKSITSSLVQPVGFSEMEKYLQLCGSCWCTPAPQWQKCKESEVKEPEVKCGICGANYLKALCGSPAAARNPAWEINHILWKFLTSPDRLRGTSMFRIAMLVLNKQEERPFISNSFQTTKIFFLCASQIAFSTELWRGQHTAHTHQGTLSRPRPMAAFHGCKKTDVTTQRWEIKYGSTSICSD